MKTEQLTKKINKLEKELSECKVMLNRIKADQRAKKLSKVPSEKYVEMINDIKNKFGNIGYFNDKRKSFRRIKICTPKAKLTSIERYIKRKYKNQILSTEIQAWEGRGPYSTYRGLCIKLPL